MRDEGGGSGRDDVSKDSDENGGRLGWRTSERGTSSRIVYWVCVEVWVVTDDMYSGVKASRVSGY